MIVNLQETHELVLKWFTDVLSVGLVLIFYLESNVFDPTGGQWATSGPPLDSHWPTGGPAAPVIHDTAQPSPS